MLNNFSIKTIKGSKVLLIGFFSFLIFMAIFYFKITPKFFSLNLFFLLPTFFAIIFDDNPNKTLATTVLFCNLAGIFYKMPDFIQVINSSNQKINYFPFLIRLEDLVVIYLFSFFGLLLGILLPRFFLFFKYEALKSTRKRLIRSLEKLESKWDLKD
jgi:hypothetical protein